ncbi:pseudouridine-5'-phosphatase-like isoform X1 [Phymastichus coffea]|uniref:pseudouridine-5'-phosphatase-like isoform X1 n=1 Tax=Phymastichus coffea TaxID=108790 RepID=UPI00273BD382|nr:pseudouridine-5'-phosphatase-like isoform X1 [Phymastichus coffea]XP_058801207.1 pseudouridine-5'-phosphatase-like isoform X1 [Phymastichus coffea]XP_058801209.1 pseudouridine-5'-phosphatase-like isoform X1 [Phymastichus coffea]XP_058801210.1 pseudouridine-5'-phosphatase-like isoform X1 [Phymastichus coffea]XP_058801211.1 pseudouridine-5'-phosphatase-like isoform X1 [Phymastichus coffea]XP_058801212.1 pseudouridine-5'-phosphatase-like isoform X1 [Phymastichus coffea]
MTDQQFKNVTHCIFDMDGLLIDSESVYKKIYRSICEKYGHSYGGDLAFEVLGRPERVGAELIINYYKLPLSIDEFQDFYHRLQREFFHNVNMMPGAERLLRHLKKHNVPIALATSSSAESFALKTGHLKEVFDLFEHKVLGGSDPDVKHGKPSPDIFIVAAKRFSDVPDPSKCLVFEDAPNGVQAAIDAGCQAVMVPDEALPEKYTEKATLVLKSLMEFKPELFGLPKFD